MKKTLIASLVFSLAVSFSLPAAAGDAQFLEQVVQEVTDLSQLVQQFQMVQQQIQMLQNQARNLQGISTQMWPSVSGQLTQLGSLMGQAQGLNMQAQDVAAQVQTMYGDTSAVMPNYEQSLQQWTTDTNSQVASVLQQYGLQASNFQSEQDALQSVQNASQSATGRLQALQAGNQIAGMAINQTQLLRQSIMSGNQAMLQIQANKANADQQDRNARNKFINSQPHYGW